MTRIFKLALIFVALLPITIFAYGTSGTLILKDLLVASKMIAESVPSALINKNLPGEIVKINNIDYQVRYFSFEDTSNKLPANITFKEYAKNKNILEMHSTHSNPLPGIEFESFDFRSVNLNDGVYFSMALRAVKK